MSVAKVIELTAQSPTSFEHAIEEGISRACSTIQDVKGAWVKEMKVVVEDGQVKEYRVDLKVSFLLNE